MGKKIFFWSIFLCASCFLHGEQEDDGLLEEFWNDYFQESCEDGENFEYDFGLDDTSGIDDTSCITEPLHSGGGIIPHAIDDESELDKKQGLLYEKYLKKGELDASLICKVIFPTMTPLQINDSLKDIKKFIERYIFVATRNDINRIGEIFLQDILYVYGHVFTFIQEARVDQQTERVFVPEPHESITYSYPLMDYWWYLEHRQGKKLHCYKFFASCIDFLTVMIRAYFLFPCYDRRQLSEMGNRWLWWLEKVTAKLHEHPVFGGYYQENVKLFREVYSLWMQDFDAKRKVKWR